VIDHSLSMMDWVATAKAAFATEKPEHFTNYNHCGECAEHDATLKEADVDTIGIEALGNPSWDPICFCHTEGKKYYLPALVRLSIETIHTEFYFEQFLFHLSGDDDQTSLHRSCSMAQRKFIEAFLAHMIECYAHEIELHTCTDDLLHAHQTWSSAYKNSGDSLK